MNARVQLAFTVSVSLGPSLFRVSLPHLPNLESPRWVFPGLFP